MSSSEKLHKILAHAGIGSRRACEELIEQGRVTVDGRVVVDVATRVDPESAEIRFDGETIRSEHTVAYLVNKPKGFLCTNHDEQGRKRVIDLVPDRRRVYCAGRLDEDSEGLIIVTNDGELTNRLTHPTYRIPKAYVVRARGEVTVDDVAKLREGVWLAEGKVKPVRITLKRKGKENSLLEIVLFEGRNREVRRMFAKAGFPVRHLRRIRIGNLDDRGLKTGGWRPLGRAEIEELRAWDESTPERRPTERRSSSGPSRRGGPPGGGGQRRSGPGTRPSGGAKGGPRGPRPSGGPGRGGGSRGPSGEGSGRGSAPKGSGGSGRPPRSGGSGQGGSSSGPRGGSSGKGGSSRGPRSGSTRGGGGGGSGSGSGRNGGQSRGPGRRASR
ncbi:MAG: pseudouridine synthase [Planctomycetota bacterium]